MMHAFARHSMWLSRSVCSSDEIALVARLAEHRFSLKANVELPAEALFAVDHGAEGVGLYRTEFLYIDRDVLPTEEEQFEIFRAVLMSVGDRGVTLRTFDLGGDKFASSFPLPAEMNPALGLRAVRLALKAPDVFLTQLRAMARASVFGDLRIMIPMISTVHEMRECRRLFARAITEVRMQGHAVADHIPFGMMIEVPSAAVMADVFAREGGFFQYRNERPRSILTRHRPRQPLSRRSREPPRSFDFCV